MDNLYFIWWKAKINAKYFPFWNIYFLHALCLVEIVPVSNMKIIRKGAHLNFAIGAICIDTPLATAQRTWAPGQLLVCGPWVAHPCFRVAHPCFRVLQKRASFPLSEGCCLRTPGYDSNIDSFRTGFSDAVTMLRGPEPTKERVEPTTIGITAIEIQLDHGHSAIAVTTPMLCVT